MDKGLRIAIVTSLIVSINSISLAAIPLQWYKFENIDTTATIEKVNDSSYIEESTEAENSVKENNTNQKNKENNKAVKIVETKKNKLSMLERTKLILELDIENTANDDKKENSNYEEKNEVLNIQKPDRPIVKTEDVQKPINIPIEEFNEKQIIERDKKSDALTLQYEEGMTYRVYCKAGWNTDIQLEKNEELENIKVGDKSRWEINAFKNNDAVHVYLKPIQNNIETNIILTTNKRVYQLSLKALDKEFNPIINWQYPSVPIEKDSLPVVIDSVDKLNFNYIVKGPYGWSPNFVFDDGYRTYIQMPQEMKKQYPTLFIGNEMGDLVPENYSVKDNNYVIPKIINNAQLRIGNEVITITKERRK